MVAAWRRLLSLPAAAAATARPLVPTANSSTGLQAAVSPQPPHPKAGSSSEDGSLDIRSSLDYASSLAEGGGAAGAPDPVMLCDTRVFEGEQEREGAVKALGVVDTPVDDSRFNAITK